ncbi:uncharacterized protein BCR38DRAFT_488864 [Pseudomassariella vexata]|uniref:Cytochrome b561 domain-containing protein n=1 Tax=Pseudomassariella vexata TaxID=1141098 RepID=A0A1Y2DIS2_9PEZI|nr:uncharacterized protein BCR38DRAFT_488864 [Pseudomassariella vexata]ORY59121.1 hypothetical protein BCR38DRAFT_488864 [Pseudomassariella vexata]
MFSTQTPFWAALVLTIFSRYDFVLAGQQLDGNDIAAPVHRRDLSLADVTLCAVNTSTSSPLLFNGSLDDALAQVDNVGAVGQSVGLGVGAGLATTLSILSTDQARAISETTADGLDIANNTFNTLAESLGVGLAAYLAQAVQNSPTNLSQEVVDGGRGLGSGMATGIQRGFNANSNTSISTSTTGVEGFAESGASAFAEYFIRASVAQGVFANNSLSSFLASNTSLDMSKITKGFMVGFLQGIQDGVDTVGGVPGLLDGTAFDVDTSQHTLTATEVSFDDSVRGGAFGFAQGLGEKGFLMGLFLLNSSLSTNPTTNTTVASSEKLKSRGAISDDGLESVPAIRHSLQARSASALNYTPEAINSFLQSAVDTLGEQGTGSLLVALQNLQGKGLLAADSQTLNLTGRAVASIMGNSSATVTNGKNTYSINLQRQETEINGQASDVFMRNLVIHMLVTALAFFFIFPIGMAFKSYRHLAVTAQKPEKFVKAPLAQHIVLYGLFIPTAAAGLFFGFQVPGTAGHFTGSHGILGLIAIILMVPMAALHWGEVKFATALELDPSLKTTWPVKIAAILKNAVFGLGITAGLGGFNDLQTILLGLTQSIGMANSVVIGFVLAGIMNIAMGIGIADSLISKKKKVKKNKNGPVDEVPLTTFATYQPSQQVYNEGYPVEDNNYRPSHMV